MAMADDNIVRLAALQDSGKDASTTEDALALLFAERHAHELRYIAPWSRWLIWNGVVWATDETRLAFSLARTICREAADQCGKAKVAAPLASAKTRAAVITLANDDRRIAATVDQWDCSHDLFNTGKEAEP
jgi:putative DNA primase/helicase